MDLLTRALPLLAALSLPLAACGDVEPGHVGGALHKAQPKPAPSAKIRPGVPRGADIDRTVIDENKANTKGIDRAVNIDENKANTKAIDIRENKFDQATPTPHGKPLIGEDGRMPGPNGKPLIGEDARAPAK